MEYFWPRNQRCISTLGTAECSLPKLNQLCDEFEIPLLELRALENRLDLSDYFTEKFGSAERLRAASLDWVFQVRVLDSSCRLIEEGGVERPELLALAKWADALNCPWIRVFDGGGFQPEACQEDLQKAADCIAWWRAQRKEKGFACDILVETHDLLCSSHNCLALQKHLDEPVGLLWDSWHIWFENGEALEETWKSLKPYVKHIHFKDGNKIPSTKHPYTYTLPGEGVFPLTELMTMLKQSDYSQAICLEWERKWHEDLPPVDRALSILC